LLGPTSYSAYYNYHLTNPQKGSYYNSQHDQSTMGIDPMNNISDNNKNTLCNYIISTLPLNKKGILQQYQARERSASSAASGGQQHQYHLKALTGISINHRKFSSLAGIVILKGMQSSSASICISIKLIHHHHHNTRLAHHHHTRMALRHSYQAGSTVLVSSHSLALRHSNKAGSKIFVLLYVTTIRSKALLDWLYVTAIQSKAQC
jgi:hypothetical protein